MMTPYISVIMSVYNCKNKELLHKCIRSIMNQTYTDWEFIICNDGSTDDTIGYLRKYEKIDKRIKLIDCNTNHGLAFALNLCIKESKGVFIARQDCDDISEVNRFMAQISYLSNHPECGFVGTEANVFDDYRELGLYGVKKHPQIKDFLWSNPFIHPSVMFRRECIELVNGYKVAKYTRRSQDYDMFMRMYAKGIIGHNIDIPLYNYYMYFGEQKKRPLDIRIDEMIIRYLGFRNMGIGIVGIPFIIKPLIVNLIPNSYLNRIKKNQKQKNISNDYKDK